MAGIHYHEHCKVRSLQACYSASQNGAGLSIVFLIVPSLVVPFSP